MLQRKLSPGDLFKVEIVLGVYKKIDTPRMILLETSTVLMVLRSVEETRDRGTIDGWYNIMSQGSLYQAWGYNIRMTCIMISY
mgnify:FL=1